MSIKDFKERVPKVIFENPDELISGGEHQKLLLDGVDLVESELNKKLSNDDFNSFKKNELVKKLDKVYVDGSSIQGDGTKSNPLSTTLPSDFEEILSYGVVFNGAEPKGVRVGNMDLHRKLPLQSQMRRCLLLDNGEVNYWLSPRNSNINENGNWAKLDGTDGQVMVFLPQFWYKVSNVGGGVEYRISEKSISGYTHSPACYISAYEASLMRDKSILSSVVNNTANYRGGNNNAEWDEKQQSLLGKPATSISLTNFIKYASNRGADWYCNYYDAYKKMCFLYLVEYANRNSQAEFISNPTDEGFKQGGLGEGVTTLSDSAWAAFNSYYPFIKCGITNTLGNKTGSVSFKMPADYGDLTVEVPSYHGIENPFGHIQKWTDGCKVLIQSDADGGKSLFYTCNNPENFHFEGTNNYKLIGNLPRTNGYIKEVLLGSNGDIMPKEVGGSSSSYFCDYFYTAIPDSGVSERGVRFGGHAHDGSDAGFACSLTSYAATYAAAYFGSRLCYLG